MKKKSPFNKSPRIESEYARQLRKIAREVGRIVSAYPAGNSSAIGSITRALARYAEIIKPWAKEQAASMIDAVNRQDRKAWANYSAEMAAGIRQELLAAPTGLVVAERLAEQVKLITSLPTQAAERVQHLATEALANGSRAAEIAKEIARSGDVTESHAMLIARTEVSRTTTLLTQARAEQVGSEGYVWRTAHDGDVRPSHKAMEGKFVRWDSPPTLDGMIGHAGCFPRCRCYPEPVIPKRID